VRVLTAALVVLTLAAVGAQKPTLVGGRFVPILATVLDRDGALVLDLERQDFTVLDNGKPQDIVFFQHDVQPFTVVVMIDSSFSMANSLTLMRAAARQFISSLLPEDTGQVGSFNDKVTFSGRFSNDRAELIQALDRLPYGNPSRFYDAMDASVDRLDNAGGRKVVLVFTDGNDTTSRRSLSDVRARARDQEVMIYTVAVQSEVYNGQRLIRSRPESAALRRLADETGGGFFELEKTTDLAPTFARVAQELRSMYTLGFTPTNFDGKRHKLEIRAKAGMTVRARRGYIASRDRLAGTH
jgi:VWFA-related protein